MVKTLYILSLISGKKNIIFEPEIR